MNVKGHIKAIKKASVCTLFLGLLTATWCLQAQPTITQQPTNQLVSLTSNAVFTIVATGTAPIRYQWYFVNTNTPWVTAGAYAQTLNGFVYGAMVTNGGAGYTMPPQISFVGGGGSGAAGYAAVTNGAVSAITVTNAGSGYATVPLVQIDPPNGLLPGKTNATLTLPATTTNDAGNYFCILANDSGSVTSSVATLKLAATILSQPQNTTVWEGRPATFNVTADAAGPYSYQWYFKGTAISGATASAYAIPTTTTNDAGNYTVVVSNQNNGVMSTPAELIVNYISQQPTDLIATSGGQVTFQVAVGGGSTLTYQWQLNGINISGNPIISTCGGNGTWPCLDLVDRSYVIV